MDCFHVHGYEQTFWHMDTVVGPLFLRRFSRRQLKARDLERWGNEPEVQLYARDPGLLKALKGISLLTQVQHGAALQNTPREGKD